MFILSQIFSSKIPHAKKSKIVAMVNEKNESSSKVPPASTVPPVPQVTPAPQVNNIMLHTTIKVRDLEDFSPQADEPEEWLRRFEKQLETERITRPEEKFEQFLKYTTGGVREFAKHVYPQLRTAKPEEIKEDKWKALSEAQQGVQAVIDWEEFKKLLMKDIVYLSGRPTIEQDIVLNPGDDSMEWFYRRLKQIKRNRPNASHFEIEQKMFSCLPKEMQFLVAPSQDEASLRHNILIGHRRYLDKFAANSKIMLISKLLDKIETSPNYECSQPNHVCSVECCSTEKQDESVYKQLAQEALEVASATPDYHGVMMSRTENQNYNGPNRNSNGQNRYQNGSNRNQNFPNRNSNWQGRNPNW